jgi:hypothetical protein
MILQHEKLLPTSHEVTGAYLKRVKSELFGIGSHSSSATELPLRMPLILQTAA